MFHHYAQDISQRASSPKKRETDDERVTNDVLLENGGSKFYVIWYRNKLSAVQ
jgi:hypothetical protein